MSGYRRGIGVCEGVMAAFEGLVGVRLAGCRVCVDTMVCTIFSRVM